jgi:hypothetical protein
VNPRIGSRAQQTCTLGEDQTVEVVRNHADGTREGLAVFPRRDPRRRGARASDSSIRYDGGAIFGQTQERQSGRQVGPQESGRDGRVGVKVRRVACTRFHVLRTPVVGTSRAPLHAERPCIEGRGGERRSQTPRNRPGETPPVDGPRWVNRTARTVRRASSLQSERRSPVGVCVVLPHALAPR